jgi:hypothetical protein
LQPWSARSSQAITPLAIGWLSKQPPPLPGSQPSSQSVTRQPARSSTGRNFSGCWRPLYRPPCRCRSSPPRKTATARRPSQKRGGMAKVQATAIDGASIQCACSTSRNSRIRRSHCECRTGQEAFRIRENEPCSSWLVRTCNIPSEDYAIHGSDAPWRQVETLS